MSLFKEIFKSIIYVTIKANHIHDGSKHNTEISIIKEINTYFCDGS